MQEDEGRICDALPTDHHPLIESAQTEIADLHNAARKGLALGPAKRRRLSPMFHGAPCAGPKRRTGDMLLFQDSLVYCCVRDGAIQRRSIWCAGLSCVSRSSNPTNETDRNQMNQIPAPRREVAPSPMTRKR